MRFTVAPILVILDDLPRETVEAIRNDAAIRRDATRAKQVELRELARLMQLAIELERDITCEAITAKDVFDFVDEDVVRELLADPRRARFPGHQAARALLTSGEKWKEDYLRRYGINILDEHTFTLGGQGMRQRGIDVPELRRLLKLNDSSNRLEN